MPCQPTHFLSCQPQWQMPLLFAMGKSLSSLFLSRCRVRCMRESNCASCAVSVIVLLLWAVWSVHCVADPWHVLLLQVSFAGDRCDHGTGYSVSACTGAPDTHASPGCDCSRSQLSLCRWMDFLCFLWSSKSFTLLLCFVTCTFAARPTSNLYFSLIWKLCSILHSMVTGLIWKLL